MDKTWIWELTIFRDDGYDDVRLYRGEEYDQLLADMDICYKRKYMFQKVRVV